jgi:hypothetical protein
VVASNGTPFRLNAAKLPVREKGTSARQRGEPRSLKQEATKPAAKNFLQQQGRFDQFVTTFNHERPHEALNMRYPAEVYTASPRPYGGLPELEYPLHDRTITVTRCGRICMGPLNINLSKYWSERRDLNSGPLAPHAEIGGFVSP